MANIVRLVLFFILLCLAAIWDLKKRIVPDSICVLMAGISFIPMEPVRLLGILAALPLFLAGMTIGGIGGGDIKLSGAAGMALGFQKAMSGLLLAFLFMLLFHGCRGVLQKVKEIYRNDSVKQNGIRNREQAYPLVPFLVLGMAVSILC